MPTPTFRAVALGVVFLIVCAFPQAARADARDTVQRYHTELLAALTQSAGKPDRARYTALEPVMDPAFDFAAMTRTTVGRAWQTADEQTRATILAAFRRVSIATNAERFGPLVKATFNVGEVRDGPRGLKLVDSALTPDGGETVKLTYVVRDADGTWRIIDVLLDGGISELAVRTSEYRKILRDGGVDALVKTLNDQADALLAD